MDVFIEKTKETRTTDFTGSVRELCEKLNVNIEEVLVVKDGVLITSEDSVTGAKKIEFLSVISGG